MRTNAPHTVDAESPAPQTGVSVSTSEWPRVARGDRADFPLDAVVAFVQELRRRTILASGPVPLKNARP